MKYVNDENSYNIEFEPYQNLVLVGIKDEI